jgi:hypothetical protein
LSYFISETHGRGYVSDLWVTGMNFDITVYFVNDDVRVCILYILYNYILVLKMDPDVANAVLSVCGLLANEYKQQILSCKIKNKIKCWVRQWVSKRNSF